MGLLKKLIFSEGIVSVSPISSTLSAVHPNVAPGNAKPIRQDFQKLATAPTSGDLAGVKDAFSAVQQLLQGSESSKSIQPQGGGNKPKNQLSTDLVAFGKALMSGDLGSAQDSVKSLLGDIEAARSRHMHLAPGGEGAPNSVTPPTRASSSAESKPIGSSINTTA